MDGIKYAVNNTKVINYKLGLFIHVYNTVKLHDTYYRTLDQGYKDTIQFGLLASDLYLLFVLLKEKNYLQPIERTLESAFGPSSVKVQFKIVEDECKNLEEEDRVVTLSSFRNAIAHGGFKVEKFGDLFYKFTNNDPIKKKKLVFEMPFINILYLKSQVLSYIEDELIEKGVLNLLSNVENE